MTIDGSDVNKQGSPRPVLIGWRELLLLIVMIFVILSTLHLLDSLTVKRDVKGPSESLRSRRK